MLHSHTKLSILLLLTTILVLFNTTRGKNHNNCNRSCGEYSLPYPFGFSDDCEIKLNCITTTTNGNNKNKRVQIGNLQVQNVTSESIFITLPAECNRGKDFIEPLFGGNYGPTWNNSFLVQGCEHELGGCNIPIASFIGSQIEIEGCDSRSDNISCFNKPRHQKERADVVSRNDWRGIGCRSLFSAVAFDKSKEVSLQFQVVELGWWLQGSCGICSENANCDKVSLGASKNGFRCHCHDGFRGDGFNNGIGCQRVTYCKGSRLKFGRCGEGIKIGVLIGVGAFLVAAVSLVCYFTRRRANWLRKQVRAKHILQEAAGNSSVPFYPYKEIERATDFFSDKNRLGTGAFGTVYAGNLHNDEWVAIKKIKYRDTNSIDQVMNEIKLLSSVSHPNLVRLLGCCVEEGEQILVYEYMPNGTLSQHLQRERDGVLSWTVRLTIATETANAIAYLHSAIDPPIYHRDIKSSNILLDYNFQSKVADFGLSRTGMTETSHISTAPQGTPGYVDPQYHQNFHLSDKSDVYSFGVVLVEIITAMKVVDFTRARSEINLAALAVDRIRRGLVDEIIDPYLEPHRDAWTLYSVHKIAELAFRCLAFHSDMRPTMMEVAEELEHIRRSGWTTMEETIYMASPAVSACSSPRNRSQKSMNSVHFERAGQESEAFSVVPLEEVRESSPVSVHVAWLSGPSSPSTNSLLGNVVQ